MGFTSKKTPPGAKSSQASAHKEASFEQLFERYYRPVRYFFTNRGFSAEESRDLAQETFLGIYKGMDRYRRDASEETWLFTIAGNVWKNEVRNRSTSKRDAMVVSLTSTIDEGQQIPSDRNPVGATACSGPLASTLDDERRRLLREAVDELPNQMKACVLLRIYQDMKYREIAAMLNISINTVKSQLNQAQDRLRKILSAYFPDINLEE